MYKHLDDHELGADPPLLGQLQAVQGIIIISIIIIVFIIMVIRSIISSSSS